MATWLLGKPVTLTKIEPSELSVEPIRADSLILLQSKKEILHIEFQVDPKPDVPFREADYFLRLHRIFPEKSVQQVVVYLRKTNSSLVYQDSFQMGRMHHRYEVIRLWECDVEQFLLLPGLLPFAALSSTENPKETLAKVASKIETISEERERSNIAASTALLAGLLYSRDVITQILRQDIMKESMMYQAIKAEGFQQRIQQGMERGIQRGIQQGERSLLLRLLNRRLGMVSPELISQIDALPLSKLEDLGEALLDFREEADLHSWFQSHLCEALRSNRQRRPAEGVQ